MPNPFQVGTPIKDPAAFNGRKAELRRIFSALETAHTDQAQHISILQAVAGLSVLDERSSGFSLDEGRKVLNLSDDDLRLTLRRLVHRDILALENDTYRFHHPLVARWIREHA